MDISSYNFKLLSFVENQYAIVYKLDHILNIGFIKT